MMKKELFKEVFRKAEKQSGSITRNGLSNHLENIFDNELGMRITSITFVRYYKKYIEDDERITNNPNADLLNKAAEYIGYKNYEDFVTKKALKNREKANDEVIIISNSNEEIPDGDEKRKIIKGKDGFFIWVKRNRKVIIINTIIVLTLTYIVSINSLSKKKQRWMTWNDSHYIEVSFSNTQYEQGQLEIYDQKRLMTLKRIVKPDCKTVFFNDKKQPKVWYSRRSRDKLELFTSPGIHPTNGKTLKKITLYMIRKYICSEY